ncbi:MAG TPA: c-type cytochrome [Verrucomicrobiae bacterium]|nr:c-type cytochrome [Verrucomicrobiae bacterium]
MKLPIRFLTLLGFYLASLPSVSVAMAAGAPPSGKSKAAPQDPFAENVRTTPWLKPEEQQKSFHLPPGFEIQLVAAEPDINKPMNLAFDAAGRLWVTTSIEYPYAAPTNKPGRDRVMIFEDFGPDGRARKVTEFAGGLNIPIGIYPFFSPSSDSLKRSSVEALKREAGPANAKPASTLQPFNASTNTWKCVVWSIPHIWLMEDTDGDGKADKRDVLYGPFDHTRDTHGNQASFRRGFDGWLYCTHGYNNDSHVKGRDGNEVHLYSGNTYRLRFDGSRIEQHTHGQVNPFGLAFDPLGNLFSSDCHSEPLYQLLAGGYYPSFGKPHDGLGYAPNMMERIRGSTAIDGVSIYADDLWPEEFHGNLFFGDVMASRVMRDRTVEAGATLASKAAPDFVSTDDPWFRPVDTTLGPDGALYIADFYNRIIGHYEVPLAHPGRDRNSGRIWRVVYRGSDGKLKLHPAADFTKASANELIAALGNPNLPRRMLATDQLTDRIGKDAVPLIKRRLATTTPRPAFSVQSLWMLHRLGALEQSALSILAKHEDRLVRVHVQRIATDILRSTAGTTPADSNPAALQIAQKGIADRDPLVQRCAAEALGSSPRAAQLRPLLDLRARVPAADTHLLYVVRKSLRDQLQSESVFDEVNRQQWSESDTLALADVAIGVKSPAAATFLLRLLPRLSQAKNPSPPIAEVLKTVARYAPESELPRLAEFANARIPDAYGLEQYQELERQFAMLKSVDEGLQQRGRTRPADIRAWGTNLVWRFFTALDGNHTWTATSYEPNPTAVPWDLETRNSTDGRKRQLTSSLPHGEQLTGVLRSPDFPLPARLSFWLCGHDGFPDKPAGGQNFIRLRVAERGLQAASASGVSASAGSADAIGAGGRGSGVNAALPGQVLASAPAPRNDIARRITWEFPNHQGERVYVEAVDGDAGSAYAWLAFGGFEPELSQLRPSEFSPRKMRDWFAAATDAAVRLNMKESAPVFAHFCSPQRNLRLDDSDTETLGGFARAWVALEPNQAVPVLASALNTNYGPVAYREAVADVLASQNTADAQTGVVTALKSLPLKSQEKLAYTMASATFSAETLLAGIESGAISPRVLQRVGVNNRLKSSKPRDWEARVKALTAKLPPADEARDKLIAERRNAYAAEPGKAAAGKLMFAKHCAACHRIGSEGALIGPQLDGIGQRGLDRLCEDILDPNRNVDRAFRSTLLVLKDGEVTSGLFRREEGELVVLAESTGKEITVASKDIAERRESETSLMPENFGDMMTTAEFADLMAFLLSNSATAAR